MTVKEIADIAGVSIQTVRRIAEKNVGYVFEAGKKAVFSEQEAIEIMRELKKKGFIQPIQNGQEPVQNGQLVTRSDLAVFGASIVTEMMKQLLPLITGNQIEKKNTIPELPPMEPRKELNMLAKEAGYAMGDYREPYNQIYKHAYYRLGINFRERAKNRGVDILDYAESEGYIPQLVAIAREIFK